MGRIVHYVSRGSADGFFAPEHRAAIVTGTTVSGHHVDLCVINPAGIFFDIGVPQDESSKRGGTWHWPERSDG